MKVSFSYAQFTWLESTNPLEGCGTRPGVSGHEKWLPRHGDLVSAMVKIGIKEEWNKDVVYDTKINDEKMVNIWAKYGWN